MGERPNQREIRCAWRNLITALLFLCLPFLGNATVHTVCATDVTCDFTGDSGSVTGALQSALDAATCGDVVEIRAGDWLDYSNATPKPKNCTGTIYIVSSRWWQIPVGRLDPVKSAPFLAKISPWTNEPVLYFVASGNRNYDVIAISSVNTSTNTITLASAHGWTNGKRVSCATRSLGSGTVPGGMVESQPYYVINASGADLKLSETPGGSAIALSSTGTNTKCSLIDPPANYYVAGIEFVPRSGQNFPEALIQVGKGPETSDAAMPHHITFHHIYSHGLVHEFGPKNCLALYSGRYIEISDSVFAGCKVYDDESHAISVGTNSYKVRIKNNYLEGASMCILLGGTGPQVAGGMNEDIEIDGNHCNKAGYMMFSSGTSAPTNGSQGYYETYTGTGSYYLNTTGSPTDCSGGNCYRVGSDGNWTQDAALPFRNHGYLMKADIEIKQGRNVKIRNNLITYGPTGQDSGNPGGCIMLSGVSQADGFPFLTFNNITIERNKCYATWRFVTLAIDSPAAYTQPFGPVIVRDNYGEEIGDFPRMSVSTAGNYTYIPATHFSARTTGILWRHNTLRPASGMANTTHYAWLWTHGSVYDLDDFEFQDSISVTGGTDLNGGNDCTYRNNYFPASPSRMNNYVLLQLNSETNAFTSCSTNSAVESSISFESDGSIIPASKYAKDCSLGGGCGFLATDGKEIGAYIPEIQAATCSAQTGIPCALDSLRVSAGSTKAALTYPAPSPSDCTVKLYTDAARTTLHSDTDTGPEQTDARAGGYSSDTHRVFLFTGLTAATPYYPLVTCGTQVRPLEFTTRATGSGRTVPFSAATARAGQVCDDSAMSTNCSSLGSSTLHQIAVSADSVHWYKAAGDAHPTVIVER